MKRLAWLVLASLALAVPALAQAADGFVTGNVNLRAGPDVGYPLITSIPTGTPVSIQGCTDGWEWCDVITMGTRGWAAGSFIQYRYQNQPVMVQDYGARIGIPIISFVIGTYWNNYYRDRPFYRQRNYWYQRPIVHRPPPRPAHRPPSRPQPGGNRPPPPRPGIGNPGHGNKPTPGPGNRPQPGQGSRPPPTQGKPAQGNRPSPRPSSGPGKRPTQGQGNRPKPQARPAPDDKSKNGN
jgi:uncharacterized protein YraI